MAEYHLSHIGGGFFLSERNGRKGKDLTVEEAGHYVARESRG
jgi:hypothetical protein